MTAIEGGTARDVVLGVPPIWLTDYAYVDLAGIAPIFGIRTIAIHQHLQMPGWLTARDDT